MDRDTGLVSYVRLTKEKLRADAAEKRTRELEHQLRAGREMWSKENAGQGDRIRELEAELNNERFKSIHSCGPDCQRIECVLRRRAEVAEKERDEWQESSGQNYVRATEAEMREERLQAELDRVYLLSRQPLEKST